ncbi:ribonuclease H-like domain-containing protein [Tanacetum coccineum]
MIFHETEEVLQKTGRKLQFDAKEPVGFDKAKVECYNCHKTGHFDREYRSKGNQDSRRRDAGYTGYKAKDSRRRSGKQEEPKALVTLDGEGVDWTSHSEDEQENYTLMAYSNSGLDTEAYTQALKKVEAQLVAHQQNQSSMRKRLEAEKEKEELKAKVEKWHKSSKNLNILLTSQMSARDKAGLGYGNQMNKGVLSYENEVLKSVFYSRSSNIEDSPVNDRYAEGMHAVPPQMIGIYIPSGPDDVPHKALENKGMLIWDVPGHMTKQCRPSENNKTRMVALAFGCTLAVSQMLTRRQAADLAGSWVVLLKNVRMKLGILLNSVGQKGSRGKYSNARTPQQNGVAERKNMTLIEAARTMLADSFLPNTFWAEAVSTACYVLNRSDPSLRPSPSIPIPDSNPEASGRNVGGQSSSDKSLSRSEDGLTLQSVYDLCMSLCKQGRKTAKSKPTAHKDQAFDDPDDFGPIDYMETEDAHNENEVSTEDQVNTVKPDEGTDKPKVSTNKIDKGTTELKNGNSDENATPTATPTVFGDDETIAEFLLANDEEIARKVQEEWETEEKNKKLAKEETTKVALIRDYDDIQARIEADSNLAARLQEEEREKFTIEERAKLLHDTIVAQRRFLAQQREAEIRSRPHTRTQLRNRMMTYLKHIGEKTHSDLKTKNFEEIQVLYEKVKRSDENFIAIGSAGDKRQIKDVNKKATGIKKDDSIKEESKVEESTRKRKLSTRKKMKSRKRRFKQDTSQDDQTDSKIENDKLRLCLTIATDEDKEVDYEILDKKYPIIEWKTEYLGTKPQYDEAKHLEEINLNVVIRSNGQNRYFSTLMRVLSIFDRDDLNVVYQLVMDRYQDEILEVIHMLVEKQYPLRKKVLVQMLELKLESEEDNTMALKLIRFVKKLIAELEGSLIRFENSNGDEKDL